MRILDMFLAFPSLVLALMIATYLGPSEIHVIWAISFFAVPAFARLARASTLRLREQPFIVAARLSGTRQWRILVRHIAPNIFPQLLTFSFLGVAVSIIVEAALDFLGLGVPAPNPSWGRMIANGQTFLASSPYLVLVPSAFLFVTVVSLNLTGDALRTRWGVQ
jgi:peptide/nickel transport system permease protein